MPIQKYLFRDPAISIQRYLSRDPASFWKKIYLHRDTYPGIRLQGYQIKDFKTYIGSQFNWLRILQEQLLILTIFEVILQEKIQELNTVRLRRPNIYSITTLLNDVLLIKTQERDTTIPQTSFTVSKNKTFCELYKKNDDCLLKNNLKQNFDLKVIGTKQINCLYNIYLNLLCVLPLFINVCAFVNLFFCLICLCRRHGRLVIWDPEL